jgi:hypothetical protein
MNLLFVNFRWQQHSSSSSSSSSSSNAGGACGMAGEVNRVLLGV